MPSHLPKGFSSRFLKIFHILEAILLVAITLSTVVAMVNEFIHVIVNKQILLTDITDLIHKLIFWFFMNNSLLL